MVGVRVSGWWCCPLEWDGMGGFVGGGWWWGSIRCVCMCLNIHYNIIYISHAPAPAAVGGCARKHLMATGRPW